VAAVAALGLAAPLLTPYGFSLWRFLWETVGLNRAEIIDWQPLIQTPAHLAPWVLSALVLLAAWWRTGPDALPGLMPAAALGVLALRVVRLEGFFTLAAVISSAPYFAALGPPKLVLSRRPTRMEAAIVTVLCLIGVTSAGLVAAARASCATVENPVLMPSWAPEPEAVSFLRANPIHGRVLTWFDYGELAIWYLAPTAQVSMDGRRETVYSETVQREHFRFYASAADASYARRIKADYVWLPRWLPVNGPLERDGWFAIFSGPRSVIYAKQAGPYVQPAPWTGPRCFPGP